MSTDQSPPPPPPPPSAAPPGPGEGPSGGTPSGGTPSGGAPSGGAPQWGPRPEEGPLHRLGRGAWQAVLAAGVAALVLGVMVLAWPGRTLLVIAVLFGVYLLVSGVMQLVAAFGTHVSTALRVMAFISGALSILLGLLCFRGAMQSLLLLALWIGIGWLFRGITQTVAAASDPEMPARGWQVCLGIISALGGVVLITSPLDSVAVLTVLGGCWLLAVGIVEIVTAFRIRAKARRVPHNV
ncbi:HdeD family acid-resistance protein [Streptomyces sp. NPDC021093]|uniref:HdeD family acid-resistance protein n=1 Tax=Streptomyces sp. NPDC021093 TaxID=3365112 RepID=UPI00379CB50D